MVSVIRRSLPGRARRREAFGGAARQLQSISLTSDPEIE
jgi:hypothetical protein